MAICKHIPCKNGFRTAVEYLTMAHDVKGLLLRDGDGNPCPREEYLIDGINCIPETFAPLRLEDRLRFGKQHNPKSVDTHQYIISFSPTDRDEGLTMEKAHRFGYQLARQNFPGHRVLVCTHPDGQNHSGNIHIHIVISSLRFEERPIDPRYMRLGRNGSVKPSEYRAGCAHQDTARLRNHLMDQVNNYCKNHGYALCLSCAPVRINPQEFFIQARGLESRNDQLRRVISDAAAATNQWDVFCEKLKTDYTRLVPVIPPVPASCRRQFWDNYRSLNKSFYDWDKTLRNSIRAELEKAFQELKGCKNKSKREELKQRITTLKEKRAKQQLFRKVWNAYAKAASTAMNCRDSENARSCLEKLKELTRQREGYWEEGWNQESFSYSLLRGTLKSRINWQQISESDLKNANAVLEDVLKESTLYRLVAQEVVEVPLCVEAKISRGAVSFKHPDSEHWIRGKRLGSDYTLGALGVSPPKPYSKKDSRSFQMQR